MCLPILPCMCLWNVLTISSSNMFIYVTYFIIFYWNDRKSEWNGLSFFFYISVFHSRTPSNTDNSLEKSQTKWLQKFFSKRPSKELLEQKGIIKGRYTFVKIVFSKYKGGTVYLQLLNMDYFLPDIKSYYFNQ